MKVDLEKVFKIDGSEENTWTFLQNIPGVASCMPGAEITEQVDANNYKGKVKAKVGPATMSFAGDIVIQEINEESKSLHFIGTGQDTKGTSAAEMDLTAIVRKAEDGTTELHGVAAVTVSGKVANFGGRMMTQVADQILNQFGKNFANNVLAMGEGESAEKAAKVVAEQPKELNGLAFGFSIFIGFIKSLFGKK
jgi:carbon monoxide dehydrogenase subunit G